MQTRTKQGIKPLRITVVGMEQRARNMLQLFFQQMCHNEYLLTSEEAADITIIDMDAVHAEQLRQEHESRYPDRPVIQASLLEPGQDGNLFLKKPIQPEALISALNRISESFQRPEQTVTPPPAALRQEETTAQWESRKSVLQPSGLNSAVATVATLGTKVTLTEESGKQHAPPPEPSPSGEIISLFPASRTDRRPVETAPNPSEALQQKEKSSFLYDPEKYLQGYIQKAYRLALRENRKVSLKGPWRPIVIIPETREIWVEQSHAHLYALAVMPIRTKDVSIQVIKQERSMPEKGGSLQSIEFFLWKLAMRTARGRIPVGTDLRAPVYLVHWPNLSRLMPVQNGLRIAALWANQPISLMETATMLDIAPKYVFSFYSVANALGLVKQQTKNSGEKRAAPVSSQPEQERRGLFRKILARLHRRSR